MVLSNKAEDISLRADSLESLGVAVVKLTSSRMKEPLSLDGHEVLQYVISILGKQKVMPDDMLLTELVNGFILEIPRMERSIVFRDLAQGLSCVAIRTPTHGSVMVIDGSNEEKEKLGEMLLHDMEEREEVSGIMTTVRGARNIPKPKMDIHGRVSSAWYSDEIHQRSEKEMAAERDKDNQRKREIIARMKVRFPTTRDFMGIPNAENIRIHGMRLNAIGVIFGIKKAEELIFQNKHTV